MSDKVKKKIIIGLIGLSCLLPILFLIQQLFEKQPPILPNRPAVQQESRIATDSSPVPVTPAGQKHPSFSSRKTAPKPHHPTTAVPVGDIVVQEPVRHPTTLNEIKKQIYDIGIEYIEDIGLLDEIVQTGDQDVRELWDGEWRSADDWKTEENGFKLEPNTDGTYTFTPDEVTRRSYSFYETPQSFSYDPDRNEFSWEVDYYGKPILNKFKFINQETAVLMIISGHKVTTNIYRKNPPKETEL